MSFYVFKKLKQAQTPDQAAEKILKIVSEGRISDEDISRKESSEFSNPNGFSQVWFYPSSQAGWDPRDRKKITLVFKKNHSRNSFSKMGMIVGDYVVPIQAFDKKKTRNGKFIRFTHPYSGTVDETLTIPNSVVEKLKPEVFERNGLKYASIGVSDVLFKSLEKYNSAGLFLSRFKALIKFHSSPKTEHDRKRFESFFKTKGVFDDSKYRDFMQVHGPLVKRLLENRKNFEMIMSDELNSKFGIRSTIHSIESYSRLKAKMNMISEENLKALKKEISETTVERGGG